MNPVRPAVLLQLAVALPLSLSAAPAFAHIDVDMGGTHKSRVSGGYNIKDAPCGMTGAPRGTNVYKYKPGATINIKVLENIPHPGYFRISFDDDGDDSFAIPSGTSGEHGDCLSDPNCGAGKEDFCSNDTVLLDNLDLHPAAGGGKTYTWSVTLPNVECTNCTLQIIQMMNDFNFHPQPYPADDIYYHCIDIELSNDAPETTDTPVENNGMNCKSGANAGAAGEPSAAGAGGASGAAGEGGAGEGAGGSDAATGGSDAEPMAAAGAAAPASNGSAGAKAASGGSAAPSTSAGAAGAKAPATGSTSSPQGTAGKPATKPATTTSSGSAGTTSTSTSESTPAPAPAEESGGCQAAGSSAGGLFAPATLGLIALGLRSYRRRRAA